jgi:hypothetical protein
MLYFRKEKEWIEKVEESRSGGQGPISGCWRHKEEAAGVGGEEEEG